MASKTKLAVRSREPREPKSYDFSGGVRGAALPHNGKTRITIWIDDYILDWFREEADRECRGYQTSINDALAAHTRAKLPTLPEIIRDIVRTELEAHNGALKTRAANVTHSPLRPQSRPKQKK
ncbi:MAG: BrnA antitoxin family protein [Candidatus Eremiobacteraeota bacterium]|nr:BrnA antitoxin family protein [Candidatus Eremiobacteraeota bacterium]